MAGMTTPLMIATILSALNVVLLLGVAIVWGRNYQTFRTPLTLGLLCFAVIFLVENALAVYFFFSMGMLYTGSEAAQLTVLAMRGLQFVALVFITTVTVR